MAMAYRKDHSFKIWCISLAIAFKQVTINNDKREQRAMECSRSIIRCCA
jgi:hypothetical protein